MNGKGQASKKKRQEKPLDTVFPIVGVGASAGGLTAFRRLLGHLPADIGMAFVIVQHLHPKRKSALVELLASETKLPVLEAQDGLAVEPNHVYVIPPNTMLTVDGGMLHLSPRAANDGGHTSIDQLFRSLAEDRESKAIGIVLSGTGTDGSLGLEEIKARGGITFAQDPETAEHGELPMHAIVIGSADYVLSPEDMAGELIRMARHPYLIAPQAIEIEELEPVAETKLLDRIFILLRTELGIDYSNYKTATIMRRIARRMAINRVGSLEKYIDYLTDNPNEVEALSRDMLITVTEFFRDPEMFEALKREVFPAILKHKSHDEPVRIWVPGCSTGEEVYSIAISLIEFLEHEPINPPMQIFGTDIKEEAIEAARSGIYPESALANVSIERRERFFVKVKHGYQIKSYIRELCVFARHDVTRDPPFSKQDLISFRNVLIYLGPTLQKKIIPAFHYALQPWGYLVLGASETVGRFSDLFAIIDKISKIFLRKQAPVRLPLEVGIHGFAREERGGSERAAFREPGSSVESAGGRFDLWTEASHRLLERYDLAGVIVDETMSILQFHGNTDPYLRLPSGKASLNLLDLVREGLSLELQTAIYEAKITNMAISKEGLRVKYNRQIRDVNVEIIPIQGPAAELFYLILFKDVTGLAEQKPREAKPGDELSPEEREIARLGQELVTAKEYLQTVVDEKDATNEELKAANEEIQSSNEELQSINEELETAKEELQSANEELTTVNEELQINVNELAHLNDDLSNLLVSVNIPIIMLGSDLRIRRFTPMAENVFAVATSDIGRPISDIKPKIAISNLEKIVSEVVEKLKIRDIEVQDESGRWYSMQVRPYKTGENKIDGAVITFVDVDALKRSLEQIKEANRLSAALNDINTSITSTLDFDEIMQKVVVEAAQAMGCSTSSIEMRRDGFWEVRYVHGLPEELISTRFSVKETVGLEIMVKTKKPFSICGDEVQKILVPRIIDTYKIQSMLLMPIIVKGEVVGAMRFVYQEAPVIFTEAQIDFANKLASSVSLALENSTLFERLQHAIADIRESRQQVIDVLESISDGFFALDSLWRITYINGKAQQLLSLRKEDVLFKSLWENLPNAQVLRLYKELHTVAEKQNAASFEERIPALEKWFEFHVYPYEHGTSVYFSDITERKKGEEALRESEGRVRMKLESILSPEGDIGNLELSDIVDIPALQSLMENFYKLAHIPMSILDMKGKMLVGVGWQDICMRFHRAHPDTCTHCTESDTQLSRDVAPGEFRLYKCKNNMWDIATPIVVGGEHLGNVFSGQFFFDDEPLDYKMFRAQAKRYGFDEEDYISALEAVPRLSRETVDTGMKFFMRFAEMLSKLSYGNIKLARSLAERDRLVDELNAISQITDVAISSLDLATLFDSLLHRLIQVTAADAAVILLSEDDMLRVRASIGVGEEAKEHYGVPYGRGFAGIIAKTRNLLYIEDVQASDKVISPFIKGQGIRSMLGVPMMRGDDVIGVIQINWLRLHPRDEREQRLLEIVADRCAVAITNAQFYEAQVEAQKRAESELDVSNHLLEAADMLALSLDIKGVLTALAEIITMFTGRHRVVVSFLDKDTSELQVMVAKADSGAPVGKTFRLDQMPQHVRQSVYEKRSVAIDYETSKASGEVKERARTQQRALALSSPIILYGEVIGVIAIDEPGERRDFSEREIKLVEGIASQAAVAIENARLYEQQKRAAELNEALNDINTIISKPLDYDEMMQTVVSLAATAIGVDRVSITMPENDEWVIKYRFPKEFIGRRFSNEDVPHLVMAAEAKAPVVINDTYNDPRINQEVMHNYTSRSNLVVPLIAEEELIGLMTFAGQEPVVFSNAQVDFATKLAASVSLAIENARLFKAEQEARRTEAVRARRLDALYRIADVAVSSLDAKEISQNVMDNIEGRFGLSAANIRILDENHRNLLLIAQFGYTPESLDSMSLLPVDTSSPIYQIVNSGQVAVVENTGDVSAPESGNISIEKASIDVKSYLALPLKGREQVVGVMMLGWPKPRTFARDDIDFFTSMASEIAVGLSNARLFEQQKEASKLSDALNEINASISSTLDIDKIMERVIVEAANAIGAETGAIIFRDEGHWLTKYSYGYEENIIGVILTDEEAPHAVLAARLKKPVAINDAYNDKGVNREIMEKYSIRSVLAIPFIVRGNTVAVLFVNYHSAPVAFTEAQVDFAGKLSASVSLALENARLYEAEHHIADTLQTALLTLPEHVEGIEFGSLYRSATEAAKIGGDFYDIFELGRGKIGIVIGDVSGKGIEATSLTTVVKNTIKAHAYEDSAPATVLSKTNDLVHRVSPSGNFVSVIFTVLDTANGRLTYCNAGHPPVLIKRASGSVEPLTKYSPVIGAFPGMEYQSDKETLKKGDILLLYTDGTIEARCDSGFYEEDRLVEFITTLNGLPTKDVPGALYGDVMACAGGKLTDDVAILAISLRSEESD